MLRWRVAAALAAAAMATGCDKPAEEGDCVAHFAYDGTEYQGLAVVSRAQLGAEQFGTGETWGCPGDPRTEVPVYRVPGVDPSIAVGVGADPTAGSMTLWGRPGFLVESPLHPLHRAVYKTEDRPAPVRDGFRCDAPRRFDVAIARPQAPGGIPLKVTPLDAADEEYLLGDGMEGDVFVHAGSDLRGTLEDGIPFVGEGDRANVVIRSCVGTADAGPGFRGLRQFVVDRMRVRARAG